MSSTKKVPVTLVLHLEWEMPLNVSDADLKFRIEENLCLDNLVELIPSAINDECSTCNKGYALVGHVKKEDISRKGR